MKKPRINLILGKKHLIVAGLALVLAVGLYANFAIGNNVKAKNTGENYGDTRLVNDSLSTDTGKKDGDIVAAANAQTAENSADEYFAKARIDRQASREEAK